MGAERRGSGEALPEACQIVLIDFLAVEVVGASDKAWVRKWDRNETWRKRTEETKDDVSFHTDDLGQAQRDLQVLIRVLDPKQNLLIRWREHRKPDINSTSIIPPAEPPNSSSSSCRAIREIHESQTWNYGWDSMVVRAVNGHRMHVAPNAQYPH